MKPATDFAFIACNRNRRRFRGDPSYIYRCENPATALRARGLAAALVHASGAWRKAVPQVAIFHRPSATLAVKLLLRWFRARGVVCIAEVDDLIFDPDLAHFSPAVRNGILSVEQARAQYRANRRALASFDRICTSTTPLAGHLAAHFPDARVSVIPNAVASSWHALPSRVAANVPVISYLPGTRSHDRDFERYAEGVEAFLADHRDARLEVTGPLQFTLRARPGQVVHRDKVPFDEYHQRVRNAWVNLAPLESTPFTRCKSALKVIEAGYWGVPTICSPMPDSERFQDCGALFADDAQACFAHLEALRSPSCYRDVTHDLPERIANLADVNRSADALLRLAGDPAEVTG